MSSFERLITWAETQPSVLGLVLSGSRGRGLGMADADWDVYMIVADEVETMELAALAISDGDLDLSVISWEEFPTYATPGSDREWDAYALVHATIVLDRIDGQIATTAEAKETLSADVAVSRQRDSLDACINALVRSAKCRRDGRSDQAMLDAAEGVAPFLDVVFASERRIRPYNRYLRWELERHPLRGSSIDGDGIVTLVTDVVQGRDGASGAMFQLLERRAREAGIHDIVTAWDEGSLSLL